MRVRFQASNRYYCLERNDLYQIGEIADIPDSMAKAFIEVGVVEPFEESFSDEEISGLFEKFTNSKDFESKVDLFMELITKSNTIVLLKNGTNLLFEVTPSKPKEWYYYNKRLCEFYVEYFHRCRLDSYIQTFKQKFCNYPHLKLLKKAELSRISKILDDNYSEGILYWYIKGINGELPIDQKGLEIFLSERIYSGVVDYLQGKVLAEYVAYLNTINLNTLQSTRNKDETKFQITGIEVPKLVDKMIQMNYFDYQYRKSVLDWFNGEKPDTPIPIYVSANVFISIIADLWDSKPRHIKNTKKFCYTYIENSFLFNGGKPERSYIEKIMKPNNENRVSCMDKSIPDIKSFTTSI